MSISTAEEDIWSQIPFPMKLTTVLNNDTFKDFISWGKDGTSFIIDNPERFESEIMPKYFNGEDYPFFTKELARWRFARQETSENLEVFACEGFEKDRWDLLEKLTQRGPGPKDLPPKSPMSSSQRERPSSPVLPVPQDGDSASQSSLSTISARKKTPANLVNVSDGVRSFLQASEFSSSQSMDSHESIEWGDESFPMKLMKVLEEKDWVHIVSWNPSGKSFSVLHPKVFEAQVMPIHFDSRSYSSFTRELRSFGFERQSKGPEAGGLFHESFQQGRWDLAEYIQKPKRTKKKSRLRKLNSRTVPRSYSGGFEFLGESFPSVTTGGSSLSMEYDTISFPMKLMNVLSDKDTAHIIAWNASGKSFSILKPKEFESNVMPENFSKKNYAAFARELRGWGFVRQIKGSEAGGFMHVYFQEGRWDLVEKMQKPKETKKRSENPIKRANSKTAAVDDDLTSASDLSDASPLRRPKPRVGDDQKRPKSQNNSDPGDAKVALQDIEEGKTSGTNNLNQTKPLMKNAEQARQFAIEVLSVPYEYAKESVEAYDGNRRQSSEYRLTPSLAKKLGIKRRAEEKSHTMALIITFLVVTLLAVSGVGIYFIVGREDSEISSEAAGGSSNPALPPLPGVPASVSARENGKIDCSKLHIEALGSSEVSAEIQAACENP